MGLSKDWVFEEFRDILSEKVLLVVGTGPSIALDERFGMNALTNELNKRIPGLVKNNHSAAQQWELVKGKLEKGEWIEKALDDARDEELIKQIVQVTGNFIAETDRQKKLEFIKTGTSIPIENILKRMYDKLSEGSPVMDIVTTNYDLLIEHCCDRLKIPCITGFVGGIRKQVDWQRACKDMYYTKRISRGKKRVKVERTRKHFRLFKVHGSIDWFKNSPDNRVIEDRSLIYDCQDIERFIITPGNLKYEKELRDADIREIIQRADDAVVERSKGYIFIGYGFNDSDIEAKIERELTDIGKPGIIVTRTLSKNAEIILDKAPGVWAVCRDEGDPDCTTIFNRESQKNPLILRNSRLWQIDQFSLKMLGE